MALEYIELSPRELAVCFNEEKRDFMWEATVYRLLKAQDLISPAYVVIRRGPHSANLRRDMRQML